MHAPDIMPILSAGAHKSPTEGACVMEMASYLAGEVWSDSPACTHPVLARMAQIVNDRLPDSERGVLLDLLPRLMGTAATGTNEEQRRLSVALAVWCAEQVAHLAGSAEPQAREAIRVARAWLAGEATKEESRAADAAEASAEVAGYVKSAYAAYAAANAAYAAANAAYAASAAAFAAFAATDAANSAHAADIGLVKLLTGLLDEHDRLTGRGAVAPLLATDVQRLAALTA